MNANSKLRFSYRLMLFALVVCSLSLIFNLMEEHSRTIANEQRSNQAEARLQETSRLLAEARKLRDEAKAQVTEAERNLADIEKSTKPGASQPK
ncbi:MAG TPA: hypothetical protein VGM76_14380 [Lacipirellulaceae bacterium]|jgi:F0F1-type ATP synthase membrane subunit b/b'